MQSHNFLNRKHTKFSSVETQAVM